MDCCEIDSAIITNNSAVSCIICASTINNIDIPLNPYECKYCGTLVGEQCWNTWKKIKAECPSCRKYGEYVQSTLYKHYIDSLIFKCACGKDIMIKDYYSHPKDCIKRKECHICRKLLLCTTQIELGNNMYNVCSELCKNKLILQTYIEKATCNPKPLINKIMELVNAYSCKPQLNTNYLKMFNSSDAFTLQYYHDALNATLKGSIVLFNENNCIWRTATFNQPFKQNDIYTWTITVAERTTIIYIGVSTLQDVPNFKVIPSSEYNKL